MPMPRIPAASSRATSSRWHAADPPAPARIRGRGRPGAGHEIAFGPDHADTLAQWDCAFARQTEWLDAHGYDERFRRMWHYYLAFCEAGFRSRHIDVVQTSCTSLMPARPPGIDGCVCTAGGPLAFSGCCFTPTCRHTTRRCLAWVWQRSGWCCWWRVCSIC